MQKLFEVVKKSEKWIALNTLILGVPTTDTVVV
jgi:hypothetical protein